MKISQHYAAKNKANSGNLNNLSFKFQNCGPTTDPFKVNQLQVQPDPLKLPGNITFSGSASIVANITGPLTVIVLNYYLSNSLIFFLISTNKDDNQVSESSWAA